MSSHGTILTLVGDISQTYHHLPLTSDEGFKSEQSEVYEFRDMCLKGHGLYVTSMQIPQRRAPSWSRSRDPERW